ncbi:hypothetical protein ES705_38675 [subsurface metagenome]
MPVPKLWSKLEDAGDVTSPQLGTGGALVGSPTYEAAKFNNGIHSDIDNEGCTFPTAPNNINNDKGTIEFWAKMHYTQTDGDHHWIFAFYEVDYGGIELFFNKSVGGFKVQVVSGGSTVVYIETTGMTWNVNDLLHFGVTWDREGNDIGGGKTLLLKVNDVEEASSTDTWDTDTVNANLYIGIRHYGTLHSDMTIDNIKTFDTCKIDFSDRNDEEFLYSGPIINSDIKWYRSVNWNEGNSHGGNINLSSEIISNELGNIFDNVIDEERIMGTTEYRKIYVYLDKEVVLFNLKLWIDQSALSPDDEISICTGGVTKEDTQEDAKNYEYISPASFAEAVVLGNLAQSDYFPIWTRRIVSPYAVPWHHSTFKLLVGF